MIIKIVMEKLQTTNLSVEVNHSVANNTVSTNTDTDSI